MLEVTTSWATTDAPMQRWRHTSKQIFTVSVGGWWAWCVCVIEKKHFTETIFTKNCHKFSHVSDPKFNLNWMFSLTCHYKSNLGKNYCTVSPEPQRNARLRIVLWALLYNAGWCTLLWCACPGDRWHSCHCVLQRCGEKTSSWGISHFLSLLLVRVSLVSKGRMFRLKGSWGKRSTRPGNTHSSCHPPQRHFQGSSCCRGPSGAHSTQHSAGKGHANSGSGSPSKGTANLLFLVAEITFKQLETVGISCVRPGHHQKSTIRGWQHHTTVGTSKYKNIHTRHNTQT